MYEIEFTVEAFEDLRSGALLSETPRRLIMMWTYRVFRDQNGRYSVREVFYEYDKTIITYSKVPVALVGDSPEEVLQLIAWFREAFDLPILSIDAVDAQIAARSLSPDPGQRPHLSFHEVIAALSTEADVEKKGEI